MAMTSTKRLICTMTALAMMQSTLAPLATAQPKTGDSPQGFQPGTRPFQNPYAEPPPSLPPGSEGFFEGDDEFDPSESYGGGSPGNLGGGSGGANVRGGANARGGTNGVQRGGGGPGMSMGGSNPVVSNSTAKSVSIDSDSGEGSKETVTDFNFPDADIMDIAKTLGRLTGKNFILDKDVKGKITIISNSPVTVGDAWKAFLTALDINGFALIPSGKYIRVARQRDARDKQAKIYAGDYSPDSDALITRIFSLKYISSEEVARTFRSIMPPNARIIPYEQTNTLIVTDTGANISKLAKLLDLLDIESYDVGIEVIPVKFASAQELSKLIDTLIPGTGASGSRPGGIRTGGSAATSRFAARKTKEGGIINTVIADDRTNSLIVHANSRGAEKVRELVKKLDQKVPSQAGGGRVHVLYLQFAEAEQIANTLNNISSGSGASAGRNVISSGGGTGSNPVQQNLFEGNIKVSADKATNSLVVTATPGDFLTVQRVVQKLDIPRDEVYVESVIMEMNLSKDFEFSTNIVMPQSGVQFLPKNEDVASFLANPFSQKGVILGFKSGATRDVSIGGQQVPVSNLQGLIKAIQTHNQGNVLATPQILTMDNTEATFESGETIPIPKATVVQGAGISAGFDRERIMLSLTLKPQINKISNMVKLDVNTKLSDISNRQITQPQGGGATFGTIERTAKTSVFVADGDTVVIGGLIRDKTDNTVSKIPILGDIPLLGWLFRSTTKSSAKSNLLIFITPHIMRQYEKMRMVLDRKLKERDDFIEKNAGGDDPSREYRDEMIRKLPDVKTLTSYRPKRYEPIDGEDTSAGSITGPTKDGTSPGGANGAANGSNLVSPVTPIDPNAINPPPSDIFAPPPGAEPYPNDLGSGPPPILSPEVLDGGDN